MITAVHANKMKPGWVGIQRIYCNASDERDVVINNKYKYIDFITCRKCDTPLRMQIQAKTNKSTSKIIDQWWYTIEPMIWINGCWWFCMACYPDYPDKTPLLPTENKFGFLESAVNLKLVTKSKPYGENFSEF